VGRLATGHEATAKKKKEKKGKKKERVGKLYLTLAGGLSLACAMYPSQLRQADNSLAGAL